MSDRDPRLRRGALNLACRAAVLLAVSALALFAPGPLRRVLAFPPGLPQAYQAAWLLLLIGMARPMIPTLNPDIASGKIFARHFRPVPSGGREEAIAAGARKDNRAALYAGLAWIGVLSLVGALYFLLFRNRAFILIVAAFFFFFDAFSTTIWCPFRAWIIHAKCCNTCRIYNWGRFMIVSPLAFVPSFWTWGLVAVSLAVLAQWEYLRYRHPQRFSELTNRNLQCGSCAGARCPRRHRRSDSRPLGLGVPFLIGGGPSAWIQ